VIQPRSSPDPRLPPAVFLQGGALLILEIVLARVLAVVMWHHFASLIIALALLGMTAGALFVHLRPTMAGEPTGSSRNLSGASFLFGLSTVLIFIFFWALCRFPGLGYRFFSVLHEPYFEPFGVRTGPADLYLVLALLLLFIVTSIPFFAGGVFIAGVLAAKPDRAGALYAADLAGAGIGCFMAVAALNVADGLTALLLAAVPGFAAALLLARSARRRTWLVMAVAATILLAGLNILHPFARLTYVRGRWQPDILYEKWSATSRVVVYPLAGGQEEGSWGQSRKTADVMGPQLGLVVDDTGYTTITSPPAGGDLTFMKHNLIALPYAVKPAAETLIIGPGGGRDILAALAMEAKAITAVEINPLVIEAVDGVFGDFSGRPYSRPTVRTIIADGRSYLRGDPRRYDVLQASVVYGRLPPSAGAFTLSEEQLYTVESFREYLGHLKEDGLLSITRFIYEKRILRLISMARAVLEERGETSPGRHLFIASERGLATMLLKKTPFTPAEVTTLEAWCRDLGYQVLYAPGAGTANVFRRLVEAPSVAAFQREVDFDVSPPTDDRPYLYYLLKPDQFWRTMTSSVDFEYEDRAIIIVRDALFLLAALSLILVLIPLVGRISGQVKTLTVMAAAGYFGGIAVGFITVEIILMKQLILYLGFPTLSLTVVLASLLIGAGLGSLATRRVSGTRPVRMAALWLAVLVVTLMVAPRGLSAVINATGAAPLPARVGLALLFVLPLGFLMGFPLPAGIGLLRGGAEKLIPWAFALNGALSVLGAMTVLALTLNYGFAGTWLLGPAGYLTAFACLWVLGRNKNA
jgi:hypothetical protein